jgi:EAL domain-containing protein (putative c-di-GMP-specific phosphodiesterase class I)
MARAIISMSETLRLDTIAEGIETPDQIAILKNLGCEMGQGYLFAKPLSKHEMCNFLRDKENANISEPAASGIGRSMTESLAV